MQVIVAAVAEECYLALAVRLSFAARVLAALLPS